MDIAQFVERSEGQWRSMRSGHSLAFQQFEEVLSQITIERLDLNDQRVIDLLQSDTSIQGTP
ncbi:MAG: phycobiliprotein lyase, partial [Synechococcus sp.]